MSELFLPPETVRRLREMATRRGTTPQSLLADLVFAAARIPHSQDAPPPESDSDETPSTGRSASH